MEQLSLASPQPVSECEPHSRDYSWAEMFLLPWPGAAAVAWPREELLARAKELPPSTSAVIEHADGTVSIALLLPTGGEVTHWDETGRIDSMGKIVNGVMRITLHYAYDAAGRVRSRFATAKRPGGAREFLSHTRYVYVGPPEDFIAYMLDSTWQLWVATAADRRRGERQGPFDPETYSGLA